MFSRRITVIAALASLLASVLPAGPAHAGAAVYLVNSVADTVDANLSDSVCATAQNTCTLRAAIQQSNHTGGSQNTINFDSSFSASNPILLQSELPPITHPVIIDGPRTTGRVLVPKVRIDAASMPRPSGSVFTGALQLASGSGGSTIRDLIITNYPATGMYIYSNNATIAGNVIGTDNGGSTSDGNDTFGIAISSGVTGTTIGGAGLFDGNVIARNGMGGIFAAAGTQSTITDNYIGANGTGADLGNDGEGIQLFGGTATIQDNFIRFNSTGIKAVIGSGSTQPSLTAGGNTISENDGSGIVLEGATGSIDDNDIIGNVGATSGFGILASPSGGFDTAVAIDNNLIAGNRVGVKYSDLPEVFTSRPWLTGNTVIQSIATGVNLPQGGGFNNGWIGTDDTGADLGNGGIGILAGDLYMYGTEVAHNDQDGVQLQSFSSSTLRYNEIHHNGGDGVDAWPATLPQHLELTAVSASLANSIYANDGLGLDLRNPAGTAGVTPNDAGDSDSGINGLLNFPVLSEARATDSGLEIDWSTSGAASGEGAITYFSQPNCDQSGYGEGKTFAGRGAASPTGSGTHSLNEIVPPGHFITAMYTQAMDESSHNNSEFSQCVEVEGAEISVAQVDQPDPVTVGKSLNIAVSVANSGPVDAEEVVLTDQLPDNVDYFGATVSNGETCAQSLGTLTCELGTIPAGETVTVTLHLVPTLPGTLSNVASVTTTSPEDDQSDNSETETTTVKKKRTSIKLNVDKRRRSLKVQGELIPSLEGKSVKLGLFREKRSRFEKIETQTAVTSPDGSFSASFGRPAPGSCKLKARFRGDALHNGARKILSFDC